jgi:hypothetical protein
VKNPSITAAFVLVALALVVGGVALSAGPDDDSLKGPVLTAPEASQKVSFENLSPHEARKKGRLEAAERELEKVRRIGKEVKPNVFKIKDDSGDPTYYYGKLIKGVGRDGEPLYLTAQFKRLPAVPLKELPKLPPSLTPKLKKTPVGPIVPKKPKGDGSGQPGDNGQGNTGKSLSGSAGG